MVRYYFLILTMMSLVGCQSSGTVIKGEIAPGTIKGKIYLYQLVNEYYSSHEAMDSAEVKDGKFSFILQNQLPELYFIGDHSTHGGYVFADGHDLTLKPQTISEEGITWLVEGSVTDQKYRQFLEEKNIITKQQILDSLDNLFFNAREIRDTAEMARIKKESMPYYDEGHEAEKVLAKKWIDENKNNALGMYLYYYKSFQRKDFPTLESIENEKSFLNNFGESAKNTRYTDWINRRLEVYTNCAIGHEAPEITGLDTSGNKLKLSDLRGKYVIVDFWNSYCKWCRLETPYLLKAQEQFKDKNFVILGVSSDYLKDKWMEAIHEDHSYWTHLIVNKKEQKQMFDQYCIKGIPHIILVGPDGKILAKELRGDEIAEVTAKYIN